MDNKDFIYLDNAATTAVSPAVANTVRECMIDEFGNPSSTHQLGVRAEARLRAAERSLRQALAAQNSGTVLWTSGGTESNAIGVLGAARARKHLGQRVVYSAIEHPAVRACAQALAREGFVPVAVPVSSQGVVDADEFVEACENAALCALMLVNNELGTIQPVANVVRKLRARHCPAHVHCDAVQALGKLPLSTKKLGVDSIAVASHKLHGPKGVGALWLRDGATLTPLWTGGGQEHGMRSGTQNVPSIAGFGHAIELSLETMAEHTACYPEFRQLLIQAVRSSGVPWVENGELAQRAPHIVSLGFSGIPAEPLLHVLESRGLLVSAGSACSEKDRQPSAVLTAINLDGNIGTLRFSFGQMNTRTELVRAAQILLAALRSFSGG